MISIKSNSKVEGLLFLFDTKGIDEMIGYLSYIKGKEASFHLTEGIELDAAVPYSDYFDVANLKIVNVDLL